jgi:hypothetical protein
MPDWINTLAARQYGTQPGFLANDIPLEEQDLVFGGPLAPQPAVEDDALDAMTKAELVDEAAKRGVDVPANATKSDIVDLLREQ